MSKKLIRAALVSLLMPLSTVALAAAAPPGIPIAEVATAGRLEPGVLRFALATARCAQLAVPVANRGLLTLIDYSRPSTSARLWVIDLETNRVLFEELVAHGRGSG